MLWYLILGENESIHSGNALYSKSMPGLQAFSTNMRAGKRAEISWDLKPGFALYVSSGSVVKVSDYKVPAGFSSSL